MKKSIFLILVAAFTILVSCKKDDDLSRKEILVQKKWMLTAMTISPAYSWFGIQISDFYAQMDACSKDDVFFFKSDGTYSAEEGTTKCDSGDPQVYETGTWSLNSDETILVINVDGDLVNLTIKEISSDRMVTTEIWNEDGINYTVNYTYEGK